MRKEKGVREDWICSIKSQDIYTGDVNPVAGKVWQLFDSNLMLCSFGGADKFDGFKSFYTI